MTTFHLFPLLPAEIRAAIYIFATPPRVVHLHQQLESLEDFKRRLPRITIAERNLRPDVDYSSFYEFLLEASGVLRHQRRPLFKQTKLEAYGFTSSKRAHFSWEFESIIPFDVLMQIATLAFPMYRRATVSCKAAIPPLLQTCSESRSYLISYGYQLAFPSTNQDPHTWFNFRRDILLLDNDFDCSDADPYGPKETEIARIPHTFHQFRPQDLSQIRRLALAKYSHPSRLFLAHKLCPELKELILVEWSATESAQALRQSIVKPTLLRPAPCNPPVYYRGEYLCMLPVEESDALWTTLELDVFGVREHWHHESTEDATLLKQHKLEHGFYSPFIEDRLCQMREAYKKEKEDIEQFNKKFCRPHQKFPARREEFPPWSIHQVQFAHICTPNTAERIVENRSRFMEQFTKLRAEAEAGKGDDGWTRKRELPYPFVMQRYSNWPGVEVSYHCIELEWWMKNGLPAFSNSQQV